MPRFLLRVEGVNFGATLYDTDDLSTIRGASLALLRADRLVRSALDGCAAASNVELVFAGASQCAFRFDCQDAACAEPVEAVRAALAGGTAGDDLSAAAAHMSFVVDVVAATPSAGGTDPLELATARNRTRQFRQWTVPLPAFEPDARGTDPFDSVRPATELARTVPLGKFVLRNAQTDDAGRLYAPSVLARRAYGRTQRQQFYEDEAGSAIGHGLTYADEFAAIVADPPSELPVSLKNKMAVLYMDGNGFGKIRSDLVGEHGNSAAAFGAFSSQLLALRKGLLTALVGWYRAGIAASPAGLDIFAVSDRESRQNRDLRLETLLWGGDELMFVMPSWLGIAALDGLFRHMRRWEITGLEKGEATKRYPLTHAAGLAICHHKTPIRQAKRIAEDLAETCKKTHGKADAASIAIFESLSPSETDLAEARVALYGATAPDQDKQLDKHLALPGNEIGELVRKIEDLTASGDDSPLPRSQLYGLLREARAKGGLMTDAGEKAVNDGLDNYARRKFGMETFDTNAITLPAVGGSPRPLAVTLGMLAELWDYASPLDGIQWPSATATAAVTP